MRRTELLQELRKVRFEEIYRMWTEKSITLEEATQILGVSDRTFRHYIDRYDNKGIEGLRGKP
ncbi:MAG: helix-turn-helix domain-containing protein [Deltaproteobacteria bacterium]|nr:helix-turn-helix domain-containing protein [Deltaproteobacteria bacterium]